VSGAAMAVESCESGADDADLAELFGALANADRLALVRALHDRRTSIGAGTSIAALAEMTGLSRFSASRHLHILRDVGLVDVQYRAQSALHRLRAQRLEQLEDWLYPLVDARDASA
jgi:DNA-binding transcriptional ArsR family regulator